MKPSKILVGLAALVGVLALIAAFAGLFWPGGSGPFTFASLHGEQVQMYGRGIYQNDSLLAASTFIGTDAVTVLIMVPLLAYALWRYRRGSLRGALLLAGALCFFLYNSAHMALAVAYNPLFLLYVVFFAASLYAFILCLMSIDLPGLPDRVSPRAPRRGPAGFLIFAGVVLGIVWLSDLLPAMIQNYPPAALGATTSPVTYVIDLGLVVPTLIVVGSLLLRRAPLGYLLGVVLLLLNAIVGIVLVSQTITQVVVGFPLTPAMVAVFAAPFILMAFFAVWFAVALLRNIQD